MNNMLFGFRITTTKIIYGVTIYGVAFKIMTTSELRLIMVTYHIKKSSIEVVGCKEENVGIYRRYIADISCIGKGRHDIS